MILRAFGFISVGVLLIAVALQIYKISFEDEDIIADEGRGNVMEELAHSYFPEDILEKGVEREWFERLANKTTDFSNGRGATMVVQVIGGNIYVDRTFFETRYAWDKMRAMFILEQLRHVLRKDKDLDNFEFILNVHDCPVRQFNGPGEGVIFSITKCLNVWSIPLPQWFFTRDGAFGNWDKSMDEAWLTASSVAWQHKEDKAVFRGAIRKSSFVLGPNGDCAWINLSSENWHVFGRGKVWRLAQERPDLFDVGLDRASSVDNLDGILETMGWARKPYLTMAEQSMQFRYVIYLEGTCGWADRLKNQLAAGMVIFLQVTPCYEFFLPLLQPWVHYIPVRNDLSNLVERLEWAKANPEAAQEIGLNAADFARTHLRQEDWREYMHAVFKQYSALMRYRVERRSGIVRFRGSVRCKPLEDPTVCDDSEAYT